MSDPFSSTIVATMKLVDFMIKVYDVEDENKVFLSLIRTVYLDIQETIREREDKYAILALNPVKLKYIDETVKHAKESLNNISQFLQGAGPEQDEEVGMRHRLRWVLSNHAKFLSRQETLATAHRSLLNTLGYIQSLPVVQSGLPSPPLSLPSPQIIVPSDDKEFYDVVTFKRARSMRNLAAECQASRISPVPDPITRPRSATEDLPPYTPFPLPVYTPDVPELPASISLGPSDTPRMSRHNSLYDSHVSSMSQTTLVEDGSDSSLYWPPLTTTQSLPEGHVRDLNNRAGVQRSVTDAYRRRLRLYSG